MRVAIDNFCNSLCPYCFAGRMGISEYMQMPLENFKKVLDWMVAAKDDEVYIYGGEPTLHPQFREILTLAKQYYKRYGWRELAVFTNAVELHKYMDIIDKNVGFLINVNSSKTLGSEEKFINMEKSLDMLYERGFFNKQEPRITFGCNIHYEQEDYSHYWKLVDRYGATILRVSVSSPCNNKFIKDRQGYFETMKPRFLEFTKQALKRQDVKIVIDCSHIPACYFDSAELSEIMSIAIHPQNLGRCDNNQQICKPDMNISVCFGDNNFKRNWKPLAEFKNMQEINEWSEGLRLPQIEDHYLSKCENCVLKETKQCYAGCFGFVDRKPGWEERI